MKRKEAEVNEVKEYEEKEVEENCRKRNGLNDVKD
jgi:hypothetical protein